MHFDLNDDQRELQRATRRFLDEQYPSERLRRAIETDEVFDAALWKQVSSDLAWTGLAVSESHGGFGFSWVELGIVLEECGRRLVALPLLASAGAAAALLSVAAHEDARAALLPGLSTGEHIFACALNESRREASWTDAATNARRDGESWVLTGEKYGVAWAHASTHLLVSAKDEAGDLRLFSVKSDTPGVSIQRHATMDRTRPLATVQLDNVRVGADANIDTSKNVESNFRHAQDIATALLACEQVGIAETSLDLSVAYAQERVQFGKPIGSFQAIKHMCADMLLEVECARSAAWYGVWAASAADERELREAAAVAGVTASEAAWRCTAEAIQIHGGIGITWEHDIHFYFKRARADELALGSPAARREAYFREFVARAAQPGA